MLIALLVPLVLTAAVLALLLLRAAIAQRALPNPEALVVGAIANFFDALGIGSFAPSMAWFKFRKLVPDRLIPSTMLVGYTPPSIAESLIFLTLLGVYVDPVLLVGCAIALVMGAVIGAPLVARSRVRVVQLVVGVALLVAGGFYILSNLHLMPAGGTANGLPPGLMIVAIAANFLFGVLVNFGVGNFAPTLAMLSLMGMDPRLSFPIMATGASLAGAAASARHLRIGEIDLRVVIGLAIGGIPAVLVAALIVRDMNVVVLRWMVAAVVIYAGLVMLHAASRPDDQAPELTPEQAAQVEL